MWPFTKPPIRRIEIVRRDITRVRLSEWRADAGLCATGGRVLMDASVQLMIQVLRNENPSSWALPPGSSLETRACYQAMIEGYTMALSNLEAMAVHDKVVPLEQPGFEAEEINP